MATPPATGITGTNAAPRTPVSATRPGTRRSPRYRTSRCSFFGFSTSMSASKTSLTPYRKTLAGTRKYAKSATAIGAKSSAGVRAA